MYTRYKPYVSPRHEFTGDTTLVTRVPVVSNSDRIVQMLMTGNYLMAGKVGYDFEADDKLPQHIEVRPGRGCDIVTKLIMYLLFRRACASISLVWWLLVKSLLRMSLLRMSRLRKSRLRRSRLTPAERMGSLGDGGPFNAR